MSNLYEREKSNNIYSSDLTDTIQSAKSSFYQKQKQRALNFMNSNVATPYSRSISNVKFNNEINGPVTNTFVPEKSFEKQFNLYKFDNNNKTLANNESKNNDIIDPLNDNKWSNFNSKDTDMTYGVVNKEDFTFENMYPNTKKRDRIIDNQNSYGSRSLGLYTGVGIKGKKKEVEPFFDPSESKKMGPVDQTSNQVRDRYVTSVGIKQNDTKIIESEQINPGDTNLQQHGIFHNNIRVLPKNIDELRPENNQQITYTLPIIQGQLGHKISGIENIGTVVKYRPDKFKENDINSIIPGRAQITGNTAPQNFIIKETARIESKEIIGPANMTNNSHFNPLTNGLIKESTRQQFENTPIKPAGGPTQSNAIGKQNYQVCETNRDTTNTEYTGNIANTSINAIRASLLDIARTTNKQEIAEMESIKGPINNINQGIYYNNNDPAKTTGRQDIMQEINFHVKGNGGYYTNLQDIAKVTTRQDVNTTYTGNINSNQYAPTINNFNASATDRQNINTNYTGNINSNQNAPTINNFDASATDRQNINTNYTGNINSNQYAPIINHFDASVTDRQNINTNYTGNINSNQYAPTINNFNASATDRQNINTNYTGNINSNQNGTLVNHFDASSTNRQNINTDYTGNINSNQYGTLVNYFDASSTNRQNINTDYTGNVNSNQYGTLVNHFDASSTNRQNINTDYTGNVNSNQYGSLVNHFDASSTNRQNINTDYTGNVNSNQYGTLVNHFDASPTDRQNINTDYTGNVNSNQYGILVNHFDASPTDRQNINTKYTGNINSNKNGVLVNHFDASSTNRQNVNTDYIGNINSNQNGTLVKHFNASATNRQETSNEYFGNTYSGHTNNKVYLQDEAKPTIKETTLIENYVGNNKINGGNKIYQQDEAKQTIKETTLIENHIGNIGSMTTNQLKTYLMDQARSTIKETTLCEDYLSNPSKIINIRTRSDINNMETSDNRELIAKERAPTWRGIAMTPNEKLLKVELKDAVTYNSHTTPNKSRFNINKVDLNYRINKKDVQQTPMIFDEHFIEIMGDTIENNPLVNNIVYKGRVNQQNSNTFTYNQS